MLNPLQDNHPAPEITRRVYDSNFVALSKVLDISRARARWDVRALEMRLLRFRFLRLFSEVLNPLMKV